MHGKSPIVFFHNGPQHRTKLTQIDRSGDNHRVNLSNFNAMAQIFREILPSIFVCFYIW